MKKSNKPKFKIGDKVIILPRKTGQDIQPPSYTTMMKQHEKQKTEITNIEKQGYFNLNGNSYSWHPDWLELAQKPIKITAKNNLAGAKLALKEINK